MSDHMCEMWKEEVDILKEKADNGDVESRSKLCDYVLKEECNEELLRHCCCYVKEAADLGRVDFQVKYGDMLYSGLGIEEDKTLSLKYYKLASDHGSIEGKYKYGRLIIEVSSSSEDKSIGIKCLKEAADSGNVDSQYEYGLVCEEGKCVEVDLVESTRYYKMSADQGNFKAALTYGGMMLEDVDNEENVRNAVKYLENLGEKTILKEEWKDVYSIGCTLVHAKKQEGIRYLKIAADKGYTISQVDYAEQLIEGGLIEADRELAIYYLKLAIGSGNSYAESLYESMISNGDGDEGIDYVDMQVREFDKARSVNIEDWIVCIEDYEFVESIGSGQYGRVDKYRDKRTGDIVAIKTLYGIEGDKIKLFDREVNLLIQVDHPCVVNIRGFSLVSENEGLGRSCCSDSFENKGLTGSARIVTDFVVHGSLDHHLWGDGNGIALTRDNRSIIIIGIAFGMRYIHKKGIIHRDLKPGNILINEYNYPEISDFGSGVFQVVGGYLTDGIGTPSYMAPELYDNLGYDESVDVYSFGVILYELIFVERGFEGSSLQIMRESLSGRRRSLEVLDNYWAEGVHLKIVEIIDRCWSVERSVRPSFEEIIDILVSIEFKIYEDIDLNIINKFVEGIRLYENQESRES